VSPSQYLWTRTVITYSGISTGLRKFTISTGNLTTLDTAWTPVMLMGDHTVVMADSSTFTTVTQYKRFTTSTITVLGGVLGTQSSALTAWIDGPCTNSMTATTGGTATFGTFLSVPGGAGATGLAGIKTSATLALGTTPMAQTYGTFKVSSASYGGGCDLRAEGGDTRYGSASFFFNVTPPGCAGAQGAGGGAGTAAKFTAGMLPPADVPGLAGGDGLIILEWFA
jgi:hypothetical protein